MTLTDHLDRLTRVFSQSGNYFVLIYFSCASVGLYYSVFYLLHGLVGLFAYEFVTFLAYLPVLVLSRRDHPLTGPIAYVQFLHHQVYSTYVFGFDSGFWLLLCCMYFAHFIFFARTWAQLGASALTTVLIFGFYFADQFSLSWAYMAPDSTRADLSSDLFVSNLAMAVGFMGISGLIIHLASNGRIDSLLQMVYKDFLTGLNNRKAVCERVWPQMSHEPLSIAIADIDDFKAVNDTLGHDNGDVVLRFSALVMQRCAQKCSVHTELARWGGEEFLIMAQTDDMAEFSELLEDIREQIAASDLLGGKTSVSVSIGAVLNAHLLGFKAAFEQADKNLYVAKRTGKNRVEF